MHRSWRRALSSVMLLAIGTTVVSLAGHGGVSAQANPTVQSQNIGGNTGTVLTDNAGKTLYTFSLDTDGTSHCADACATAWPPLELASGNPTPPTGLSGSLGVINRSDGKRQVTYNNQPLYYFSRDTAAGQATGGGVSAFNGTFRVAQPAGVGNASAGAPAPGGAATVSGLPSNGTGGLMGNGSRSSMLLGMLALAGFALSGLGVTLYRSSQRHGGVA
jgi:predicted lipoprotein with Yx(FWY)xxD motif